MRHETHPRDGAHEMVNDWWRGRGVATAEHCSCARTRQRADRWASHPAPIAVEYARAGHCGQGCTARRSV